MIIGSPNFITSDDSAKETIFYSKEVSRYFSQKTHDYCHSKMEHYKNCKSNNNNNPCQDSTDQSFKHNMPS